MLRSRSVRPRHAVACSGLRLAVAALLSPISVKDVLPSDGTYKQSPAPGDRVRDNLFMRRMANLFTASAFSDFAILQVEEDHQLEHSSHSPESDQHKRTTEQPSHQCQRGGSRLHSSQQSTHRAWSHGKLGHLARRRWAVEQAHVPLAFGDCGASSGRQLVCL
jgi:hypothetical protein